MFAKRVAVVVAVAAVGVDYGGAHEQGAMSCHPDTLAACDQDADSHTNHENLVAGVVGKQILFEHAGDCERSSSDHS